MRTPNSDRAAADKRNWNLSSEKHHITAGGQKNEWCDSFSTVRQYRAEQWRQRDRQQKSCWSLSPFIRQAKVAASTPTPTPTTLRWELKQHSTVQYSTCIGTYSTVSFNKRAVKSEDDQECYRTWKPNINQIIEKWLNRNSSGPKNNKLFFQLSSFCKQLKYTINDIWNIQQIKVYGIPRFSDSSSLIYFAGQQ